MKKKVIFVLLLVLAVFTQLILGEWIQIRGIRPDFLLILLIFWAWNEGWKEGLIVGFIIGILKDILFSPLLGLNAFALLLSGFLVGEVRDKIYGENVFLFLIIVGLVSILNEVIISSWLSIFHISSFLKGFPVFLIFISLYNCFISFFVFLILSKIKQK